MKKGVISHLITYLEEKIVWEEERLSFKQRERGSGRKKQVREEIIEVDSPVNDQEFELLHHDSSCLIKR